MASEQLHSDLTKLHQQLSTVDNVDESTKAMLVTVMQDIAKLLTGEPTEGDTPPTSGSIRELMTEFEAEHPKLARTLGQLADGLQNLGI